MGKPWGITFSDGSCDSYGAVLYLRWEKSGGDKTRLVDSKAKLTSIEQKGDAVKAEICGAVFATRLKGYFLKYSRLEIDRWYHFLDSQTVLGAIQWESYGFQTFFANRVGEIQKAGPVTRETAREDTHIHPHHLCRLSVIHCNLIYIWNPTLRSVDKQMPPRTSRNPGLQWAQF